MNQILDLAQIVELTEVEGPGLRAAVWLQGCSIRCPGCCNPQFFHSGGTPWNIADLITHLAVLPVEGITLLGGEPLDQAEPLLAFLTDFRQQTDKGIMLFSGHPWAQIQALPLGPQIVTLCDLIVAGPYIAAEAPDTRRWIGSHNQTTHFITQRYDWLEKAWDPARRELEIHVRDGEIILNGMPFEGEIWKQLTEGARG
ncbi:MAG: 4Fe-4S single cluster domain-containing protein [Candidatus Sericytochromatia bacterium]